MPSWNKRTMCDWIRIHGPDRVRVLPHVSSVALACARLGWTVQDTEVISLVTGEPHTAVRRGGRAVVLSRDRTSPNELARLLTDARIVRNRQKIEATVSNARAVLDLAGTGTDLGEFLASFAPDPADPWFNLTVIEWGIRQMRMGLADFWNLPIFFPARAVTTYSDHLIGPAALGALFTAVFPNAVAFYNLLFLGSFVLCGWSTWYILRQAGTGVAAAFLGGCMFAFSPIRAGDRYLAEAAERDAVASAVS